MNSHLPSSIRELDSCARCKHCVVEFNYDDAPSRYCGFGAPPAPKTFSELAGDLPNEELMAACDKFDEWSKGRSVCAWSTCDHFEKKEQPHA